MLGPQFRTALVATAACKAEAKSRDKAVSHGAGSHSRLGPRAAGGTICKAYQSHRSD